MRLSRSLLSLPQCRPLFGPLQVFLIRWSPGCGIINSAMKAQVDTRILKISPQRKYIYFQCCKVLSYMSLSMAPHACQLSLSLESFSAECSWCGQQGNVSFPRRWVGDVIVRDCRRCVICGYWGIRLALTPRTPETEIFTIYVPGKYQTEPNIGFRILFSSGSLVESLTLSRKLKLEMLFPPDTSTHLLLQQLEENNLKEKYPFLLELFIDNSFSLVCKILCKFSVTHLQF